MFWPTANLPVTVNMTRKNHRLRVIVSLSWTNFAVSEQVGRWVHAFRGGPIATVRGSEAGIEVLPRFTLWRRAQEKTMLARPNRADKNVFGSMRPRGKSCELDKRHDLTGRAT